MGQWCSRVTQGTADAGAPKLILEGISKRFLSKRATVEALAASFRVITFSLEGSDLDSYAKQVLTALDQCGVDAAVVCGVSFGGLIAVRFAATYPQRCTALVLASTPKPALTLRRRHQMYLALPWLLGHNLRVQGSNAGSLVAHEAMNRAVAESKLRPVIERVVPFSDAAEAVAAAPKAEQFGKVCFSMH